MKRRHHLLVVLVLTTTVWSLCEACNVNIALQCRSSTGIACGQLQQRTSNCYETISWEITIRNTGAYAITVGQLDLTKTGGSVSTSLSLVGSLPVNPIAAGASTGLGPQESINLCQTGTYSGTAMVSGQSQLPGGSVSTCQADAVASFTIQYQQVVPRSAPVPGPVPVPTSPTGNCRVICAPGFTCSADGLSCFRSGTAPQGMMPVSPTMPVPAPIPAPRSMTNPVPVPVPTSSNNSNCRVICARGFTCSADGGSCYRSNSGTTPTAPPPVPIAPRPVSAPVTGPTPSTLPVVDCILTPAIVCRRSDGSNCNTLTPRSTNCRESVTYEVTIRNNGNIALTVTVANLIVDGTPINFLTSISNPIAVGQSVTTSSMASINVCNVDAVNFNARIDVRAMPPSGNTCRIIPPSPPPPVMQPVMQPVRMPPVPAPMPRTVVDCTVEPGIQCFLTNGQSCSTVVTRTTNCIETFRYVLSIRSTGTIPLPIDAAAIVVNGNSINVLSGLSSNPIPVGATSTASTDVSVNVCNAFSSQASINVRVGQVDASRYMCRNFLPSPTTIIIGGPPVPTPVRPPQMVPSPPVQSPQLQLVDCILRSTLVSCEQANGSSCNNIIPPPSCAPVSLFFNVRIENAGTVQLSVTSANLVTGAGTINLIPILPANPISIAQVSTLRVPVALNVCQPSNLSASVNVRGAPPAGFICR